MRGCVTAARTAGWAAVSAISVLLSYQAFWPKVTVAPPDADPAPLQLRYVVTNDSFFLSISNVRPTCAVKDLTFPNESGIRDLGIVVDAPGSEHYVSHIGAGESHTFSCEQAVAGYARPKSARIALLADYHYLGIPLSKQACFRLWSTGWLPEACTD